MHILYLIYWVISNNTDNYTFTKNIKAYKGVYYEKFYLYFPELPHQLLVILQRAKNNGLNVLGIVDQPYDELSYELKNSLNEYYRVDNLENYESVYRAVAFFIHKYGRVDWLESNNEYWLEQNAKLRSDFNIQSGFQTKDIPRIKFKSKMKSYYEKAGISTARYTIAADLKEWKAFTKKSRLSHYCKAGQWRWRFRYTQNQQRQRTDCIFSKQSARRYLYSRGIH